VATNHRWLAMLGAFGYDSLLAFNRVYNKWRAFRGKEYFSISKAIKGKVKSAVSFVDRYEEQLQKLAHQRECDGIICGHIHTPADKIIGDVHYLNSGDWVESLTAIVEHHDGRLELITYPEFMKRVAENMTCLDD
jgi:UDP-2,3-diacylglucosamine pyrophosphatase LpxH